MKLTNEENCTIESTVYIVQGEHESLLGREDAKKLGIIKVNPRGTKTVEVGCITPEVLKEPIKEGVVSGGQTQSQIDASMEELASRHEEVFKGMG